MCGKNELITFGKVVTSLKGHDTGRRYLVVSEIDENFVLVCDGEYRKLDNPKQKRKKHLKPVAHCGLKNIEDLTDNDIRKLLNF